MIKERFKEKQIVFKYIDIGPIGLEGVPANESKIRNWPQYCLAPFDGGVDYRFILIDGIFKKACAYISWSFMSKSAILAVRDRRLSEELYLGIEKFFDIIDRAENLVLFKKKEANIDESYVISIMNDLFGN